VQKIPSTIWSHLEASRRQEPGYHVEYELGHKWVPDWRNIPSPHERNLTNGHEWTVTVKLVDTEDAQ